VVNKADAADPAVLERVLRDEPNAVVVSVRTGDGMDALLARIADQLPHPEIPVTLLVPFTAGGVVSRVHRYGEVQAVSHTAEGTRLDARLPAWLAGELEGYAVT
jgi:GTP-binding protein HflX